MKRKRLTDYEMRVMAETGKTVPTNRHTEGIPIGNEERERIKAMIEKTSNRVKIVHSCSVPIMQHDLDSWSRGTKKLTMDFSTRVIPSKVKKDIILKFTKRDENWWEKFPAVYVCPRCSLNITREEVASQYFIRMVGEK